MPVTINDNKLIKNGLRPNKNNPQIPKGYNGVYLLGGRANKISNVLNNEIIDQAPIDTIQLVYYMVVNGAKATTNISENKLIIPENHNQSIEKYGIGIINCYNYVDEDSVKKNNTFSKGFKSNIVVDNQ